MIHSNRTDYQIILLHNRAGGALTAMSSIIVNCIIGHDYCIVLVYVTHTISYVMFSLHEIGV